MKLLNETPFKKLPARLFVEALLLELKDNEPILTGDEYLLQRCDYYDPKKRNSFIDDDNCDISDIKKDINQFAARFANGLRSTGYILEITPNPSPYSLGLSEYFTIILTKPLHAYSNKIKAKFANDFVLKNEDDYKLCARLSDHKDEGAHGKDDKTTRAGTKYVKPKINILYEGRTFLEVADELKLAIENYIKELKDNEDSYVDKKWKNYKRKQKRLKDTTRDEETKTESWHRHRLLTRLSIKEW